MLTSHPRNLLPHGESMVLIDEICSYDSDSIKCRTLSHQRNSNPLMENNRISAVYLIEYGAQAMALHESLEQGKHSDEMVTPVRGVISALKDIKIRTAHIENIPTYLTISAKKLFASNNGAIYTFSVKAENKELASGRLTVQHQ